MNELSLALPSNPALLDSTLPTQMFKEEFADVLIKAGLKALETIPFAELKKLLSDYGHSFYLEPHFFALSINAYADQNNLIIDRGLIGYRRYTDFGSFNIMFASRTSPTVYINIKQGEELDRLLQCFQLKASDMFKATTVPILQFTHDSSRFNFSVRVLRTDLHIDSADILPKGFLEYMQDTQIKDILQHLEKQEINRETRFTLAEVQWSIRRLKELQKDIKEFNADYFTYLDFGMLSALTGQLPAILLILEEHEGLLDALENKRIAKEKTLTYLYCKHWSINCGAMILWHAIFIILALFAIIRFAY